MPKHRMPKAEREGLESYLKHPEVNVMTAAEWAAEHVALRRAAGFKVRPHDEEGLRLSQEGLERRIFESHRGAEWHQDTDEPAWKMEGGWIHRAWPLNTFGLPPDRLAEADFDAWKDIARTRCAAIRRARWVYESGYLRPKGDERAVATEDSLASDAAGAAGLERSDTGMVPGAAPRQGERVIREFRGPAYYRRMLDEPGALLVVAGLDQPDRSKAVMAACRMIKEELIDSDPTAARKLALIVATTLGVAVDEQLGPVPFSLNVGCANVAELVDHLHAQAIQQAGIRLDDPDDPICWTS